MGHRAFDVGNVIICSESGVIGRAISFYYPTSCEEQTLVRTPDGRDYHAPTRTWRLYPDRNIETGIDVDKALTPYGEYVVSFASNHGCSITEAIERQICEARLSYFNKMGE